MAIGITVILTSLLCRRKHNVGRQVAEQWVFGGVEVGTPQRRGFLVPVNRRDATTLLPVLQQYVVSDCCRPYYSYTTGSTGYRHLTVNRAFNFVDPYTGACTNHVECYWKNAKMRNKREGGTARTLLGSYLIEYIYGGTSSGGIHCRRFD